MSAGGEGRRALVATALGAALGLIVVLFSRSGSAKEGRRWRGRSAT
jgi:hypothetical protein